LRFAGLDVGVKSRAGRRGPPQDRPLDRALPARDGELADRAARSVLQRQYDRGYCRGRTAGGAGRRGL